MFTGIIQSIGRVVSFQKIDAGARLVVDTGLAPECLSLGDSIAVDGCCQTIAAKNGTVCTFDALHETLERTIFRDYRPGRRVNIEPALRLGDRLGGHLVQGHIDTVSPVLAIRSRSGDRAVTLKRPSHQVFPLVEKGSIAINGISLTVAELTEDTMTVCIIPHTWTHTALGDLAVGDHVNLESDVIGRYVISLLQPNASTSRITDEMLRSAGFGN
ncbi:MAG: riboflavin synthase [Victivallales bacterium]|nr:riboflavin synthase [Victivallales bacterium]